MTIRISKLPLTALIALIPLLAGYAPTSLSAEIDLIAATLEATQDPSPETLEDGLKHIQSALLEAQRQERFADKIKLLQQAAQLAERKADWVEASRFWKTAIELATEHLDDSDIARMRIAFATFLRNAATPDKALAQLRMAEAYYREQRNAPSSIAVKQEMALILAEQEQSDASLTAANASVSSATALADLNLMGETQQTRAVCAMILEHSHQRELAHAILQYIRLLHARESMEKEISSHHQTALQSLESAIGYFLQSGADARRATSLKLKGDVFLSAGRIADARHYYEEAYKTYSGTTQPSGLVGLQVALAVLETLHSSMDSALLWINQAIQSSSTHPDLAWILLLKAEIALKDYNDPLAKTTLQQAIAIADSPQDLDVLIALHQLRSLVEINLGNYREGFDALDTATQYQVQQIRAEKEQIEKSLISDMQNQHSELSAQFQERVQALEIRLFEYQVIVRNLWIIAVTFSVCFAGWFALGRHRHKRKERELQELRNELLNSREALRQSTEDHHTLFKHLAHELRTPMNGIVGSIPLLHDTHLSPLQENCVNILDVSSRSITTLINDISDLTQLNSGRLQLASEPVLLTQIVETVVHLFEADSEYARVELLSDIPSDPIPLVETDPNRIQQILITLTGWALQHTLEGQVSLHLEWLEPHSGNKCKLRFFVETSGYELAPDTRNQLFEIHPYSTPQSAANPSSMMGMSLTQKLIDRMQGDITVIPGKPGGTRIQVDLSLPVHGWHREWHKPEPLERFHRKRALIIDSSQHAAQILARHLQCWAMYPEHVEDVSSANNLLEHAQGFDIIFLDSAQSDPGLTLLEQIAAIRSHAEYSQTPIVLMTRFSQQPSSLELHRQPSIYHLSKPLTLQPLHNTLCRSFSPKSTLSKSYAKLTPESVPPTEATLESHTENSQQPRRFHFMPFILPMRRDIDVDPELTILLAEDNPVNQKVTGLMLKKMGYDIDIVPNGKRAVEAVQEGRYDVVLMDKIMPVLDGLGAAREIRKLENITQPIIIALTASATMEDEIACRKASMDNFLAKPVQLEKMKAALGFATHELKQRRLAQQEARPQNEA